MRAGLVQEPGTPLAARHAAVSAAPRGAFYPVVPPAPPLALAPLEAVQASLPAPWVEGHPEYRSCYDFCVRTLFANRRAPTPGSGLPSPYLDAAFNENVFWWDTAFMTMFARLVHPWVPGICSLDNFYARQFDDGEICRELNPRTGAELVWWTNLTGGDLYSFYHRAYGYRSLTTAAPGLDLDDCLRPDLGRRPAAPPYLTLDALNHPIAAWAELLSFAQTGDLDRLRRVVAPLAALHDALTEHLRHANGLYASDWASMDNSPRNAYLAFGVDTACEMVLFAEDLLRMDAALAASGEASGLDTDRLRAQASVTSAAVNDLMWDPERAFYFDLDADLRRGGVRTVAAFWALLSGVATGERADALVAALCDPEAFARPHPVPTVAADEPGYVPEGGYWRGGVWAPTNMMVVSGLDRSGRRDLATRIARRHVDALARLHAETGTVYEYYSPEVSGPGANDHADFVGWSGIGPIGMLITHVIGLEADAARATLTWHLGDDDPACGVDRYWFGGRQVDLAARRDDDGWVLDIGTDAPFTLVAVASGTARRFEVSGPARLRVVP